MSEPCCRPSCAELKEQRSHKRQQEKALREQQRRDGLLPRTLPPLPNTTSTYASIDEEQQAREAAVSGQFRILRRELPALLKPLPHADTLFRLLRDIDVAHLEQAHVDLVRRLIRAKPFVAT